VGILLHGCFTKAVTRGKQQHFRRFH